jgi:hypothetical protein
MINYFLRLGVAIILPPKIKPYNNSLPFRFAIRLCYFQIFTVTTICHALFILHDLTTLNVWAKITNYERQPSVSITTRIVIPLYLKFYLFSWTYFVFKISKLTNILYPLSRTSYRVGWKFFNVKIHGHHGNIKIRSGQKAYIVYSC